MTIYWQGDGITLQEIYAIRDGESKEDRKRRLARERASRARARARGVDGVPFWPVNKDKRLTGEHRDKIRQALSGESHRLWAGDDVSEKGGRKRALRMYPKVGPCVLCGSEKSERHHRDGNTANNEPDNIQILCRRCHMATDGRLETFLSYAGNGWRNHA